MKKISTYLLTAMCICAVAFSAGAFMKANAHMPASPSAPVGQPVDLTYAAEKALPSVVHILSTQNSKTVTREVQSDPFEDFFSDPFGFFGNPGGGQGGTQRRQFKTPKRQGAGSGVIISADGYIVTNHHVVDGADELTVTLNDNKEYSARIIGTDKTSDIALIKINASGLQPIAIANSDDIKVGEWVLAVGNPFNLTNTVTAGIVSAKARTMGQNGVESFIQTDAAINRGNSGGALVNARGELIGINDMLYSETGSYVGYGFAIPTSIMNKVVDDIKKYGTVQRAFIGIRGSDVKTQVDQLKQQGKEVVDYGTMEGVYVGEVVENGAAEAAGIKPGDVIVAVDGKKIAKFGELTAIMANKKPGDKLTLTYLHNKQKVTKTVTLKNEQGNTNVVKQADLDVLGAVFRPITDNQKEQLNISYGLEVLRVDGGKRKKAGINKGFIIQQVNDTPVRTVEELQDIVKSASTSKDPVLIVKGIYPSGKKGYAVVDLQED